MVLELTQVVPAFFYPRKPMKTNIKIANPYKIELKDLFSVLIFSVLVVSCVAYGLTFVEKVLEPRLALAEPLTGYAEMTFYTPQDGYVGNFGQLILPEPSLQLSLAEL